MNGRRRKALAREFRALNGRAPMPAITALVENKNTFVNKEGRKQFEAGYEQNGQLYFRKIMGVGITSELRALKKAHHNGGL